MRIDNVKCIGNSSGLWIRTKLTFSYFLQTRQLTLWVIIAFIVFIAFVIGMYGYDKIETDNWSSLGNLFNIGTLLIVLAVWWAELREDWRNSLPHYLSAKFYYEGKEREELSYDEYAPLIDGDDKRGMSQQLGKQKADEWLEFDPTQYRVISTLSYGSCENVCKFAFWHHTVTAELTKLPKISQEEENKGKAVEKEIQLVENPQKNNDETAKQNTESQDTKTS